MLNAGIKQRIDKLRAEIDSGWDELAELCSTPREPHELSWRGMIRAKIEKLRQLHLIVIGHEPEEPFNHQPDFDNESPEQGFAELEANRQHVYAEITGKGI